jgi:hypothetical protein
VLSGSVPLVSWLIAQGAQTDAPDFQQRTPLARAVALGPAEREAVLRASGAA